MAAKDPNFPTEKPSYKKMDATVLAQVESATSDLIQETRRKWQAVYGYVLEEKAKIAEASRVRKAANEEALARRLANRNAELALMTFSTTRQDGADQDEEMATSDVDVAGQDPPSDDTTAVDDGPAGPMDDNSAAPPPGGPVNGPANAVVDALAQQEHAARLIAAQQAADLATVSAAHAVETTNFAGAINLAAQITTRMENEAREAFGTLKNVAYTGQQILASQGAFLSSIAQMATEQDIAHAAEAQSEASRAATYAAEKAMAAEKLFKEALAALEYAASAQRDAIRFSESIAAQASTAQVAAQAAAQASTQASVQTSIQAPIQSPVQALVQAPIAAQADAAPANASDTEMTEAVQEASEDAMSTSTIGSLGLSDLQLGDIKVNTATLTKYPHFFMRVLYDVLVEMENWNEDAEQQPAQVLEEVPFAWMRAQLADDRVVEWPKLNYKKRTHLTRVLCTVVNKKKAIVRQRLPAKLGDESFEAIEALVDDAKKQLKEKTFAPEIRVAKPPARLFAVIPVTSYRLRYIHLTHRTLLAVLKFYGLKRLAIGPKTLPTDGTPHPIWGHLFDMGRIRR